MNNYKQLKEVLFRLIETLSGSRSLFVENPETDFTRERKLTFDNVLKIIFFFEGGNLNDALLESFEYSIDTPSASAFVQARSKIKIEAFISLFNLFNEKTRKTKLYKGYRLLAIDGCEVPIDAFFKDSQTTLRNCNQTGKSYSAFHLNPIYDLLECTYDDLIIQGQAEMDEIDAFCQLVDRYSGRKAIFIADRGYESYNGFEHVVRSGNKYLVRVRDIESKNCMTRSLGPYPDEDEFDIDVSRILTIRQTNEIKANKQKYKFCPKNSRFDFMDREHPYYEFGCRIVRFRIGEDSYETIITNLDREDFDIEEIKKLYNMRWGIETSFRLVKYALDLNAFHSKKRNLIQQEIYARLLLYNFCQRIVQDIEIKKKDRQKYMHQVNFTEAFHIIRNFLKMKKGGKNPPLENLIVKYILPIRPGRRNTRHVSRKKVVYFNYRFN